MPTDPNCLGYNQYDKIIPLDSTVQIDIPSGTKAGVETVVEVLPDEGFLFNFSKIELTVPDDIEANLILTTEKGDTVLFKENITNTTKTVYSSDVGGLCFISKVSIYVKVTSDLTESKTVLFKYNGKQVIPFL